MNKDQKKCVVKKSPNNIKVRLIINFIVLIIQSLIIGTGMLLLTDVPSDFTLIKELFSDIRIIILNTLPILFILFFFYFITNRVWSSFLITSILFMLIAEVNRFKIIFRDDPFVFKDIYLFKEAQEMTGRYKLFIDKASLCVGFVFLCIAVISIFLFREKIKSGLFRCIGCGIALLGLCVLCGNIYFGNSDLYESLWNNLFGNQWKTANQYMSRGVVYSFIRSIPDAFSFPPEDYDEKQVKTILSNYEEVDMPEQKKVNIISVMLEAYCDLSVYDGITFSVDPYQNFHKLQEASYHGSLYTNIFAGGTVATERSFLTGYNNSELNAVKTESYVRYFKRQGYYTEAMHPCFGWFYDRRNINEGLGFDNFDYYENAYSKITEDMVQREMYSGFLSDYDFFQYIIKGYENAKERKQNYFNFSVTYQNHGPYSANPLTETEYITWKEGYNADDFNILNNYLNGISHTDEAIGNLYQYISQENEPIILIIFGDHKPWLGDNNSVYDMLGIDFDMDKADEARSYYETPYIIYANDSAKKVIGKNFEGEGNTISPMFLMNELFDYMEIGGSQYLIYLADVKKEYDVINNIYVGKGEHFKLKKDQEDKETLKIQEWMEYYMKTRYLKDE